MKVTTHDRKRSYETSNGAVLTVENMWKYAGEEEYVFTSACLDIREGSLSPMGNPELDEKSCLELAECFIVLARELRAANKEK